MSTDQPPPQRVRVTGPPRRRAGVVRPSASQEIDAESVLGEVFMRSLLREQLRLAGIVLLVLGLTLGALPLLFHLAPALASRQVGPLPLAWLVLGALAYPWLVLLGWWYLRRAETNERDFASLLAAVDEDPT